MKHLLLVLCISLGVFVGVVLASYYVQYNLIVNIDYDVNNTHVVNPVPVPEPVVPVPDVGRGEIHVP